MNTINSKSTRPAGKRLSLGILTLFTAATVAASAATEEAELNLRGKQFGHGKALKATSGNWQIKPSKLYHYSITGTIRGKSGALAAAFPNSVPLDTFLESIKRGSSSLLEGTLDNPNGTIPATLFSRTIKGSRTIQGLGKVSLQLKFSAKIATSGQLLMDVTKVKLTANGVPLKGVMAFGKGSKLKVSTAPIVEFKALGQAAFDETAGNASVIVWRLGNKNTEASVDFATADDTASAGLDYTATTGTVTFAVGESEKTILIPIINNTTKDGYRKFTVSLSNPASGTVLGTKLTNTVAINNDD